MLRDVDELERDRDAAGIGKAALATRADVKPGTYSEMLHGGANPKVSTLRSLNRALDALIQEKRHGRKAK